MIAGLIGIAIAFMLPKRIECGFGGNGCKRTGEGPGCSYYEVEPFGFYLLETLVRTDIGFAYEQSDTCRH